MSVFLTSTVDAFLPIGMVVCVKEGLPMPEISDIRTRAVLPISTVIALTDLSARQIRYYEAQGLLHHSARLAITGCTP